MTHTPGPWSEYGLDWRMVIDGDGLVVADIRTTQDDARLIAAAPDLLEALEFTQRRLEEAGGHLSSLETAPVGIAWRRVCSAIAKARGES